MKPSLQSRVELLQSDHWHRHSARALSYHLPGPAHCKRRPGFHKDWRDGQRQTRYSIHSLSFWLFLIDLMNSMSLWKNIRNINSLQYKRNTAEPTMQYIDPKGVVTARALVHLTCSILFYLFSPFPWAPPPTNIAIYDKNKKNIRSHRRACVGVDAALQQFFHILSVPWESCIGKQLFPAFPGGHWMGKIEKKKY